jgi:hypothetical protein
MADLIWQGIAGALIIAIIVVLVAPGSTAGTALTDISGALQKVVALSVS